MSRFARLRSDGLLDEPRPGAPRRIGDEEIEALVDRTLSTRPQAATHWSLRTMAKATGLSVSTVGRVWRAFGLQPHRAESFKLSADPRFAAKVVWQEEADGAWAATPLAGNEFAIDLASFSPDGTRVVTKSVDGTARVWREGADGAWTATPAGRRRRRGRFGVGLAGRDPRRHPSSQTARVWRKGADGTWTATPLAGHEDAVRSASFSPDGSRIVTASDDGTVRVWEASWLIGEAGRAWANAHKPSLDLKPLLQAACAEKLVGTERIVLDHDDKEIGRESERRLTKGDTETAPILRGHEGEDVCVWQPSPVDRWLN